MPNAKLTASTLVIIAVSATAAAARDVLAADDLVGPPLPPDSPSPLQRLLELAAKSGEARRFSRVQMGQWVPSVIVSAGARAIVRTGVLDCVIMRLGCRTGILAAVLFVESIIRGGSGRHNQGNCWILGSIMYVETRMKLLISGCKGNF